MPSFTSACKINKALQVEVCGLQRTSRVLRSRWKERRQEQVGSWKPRRLWLVQRETYRSYARLRHRGYGVYLYEGVKPVRGESSRDRRTGASRAVRVELQTHNMAVAGGVEVVHQCRGFAGGATIKSTSAVGVMPPAPPPKNNKAKDATRSNSQRNTSITRDKLIRSWGQFKVTGSNTD